MRRLLALTTIALLGLVSSAHAIPPQYTGSRQFMSWWGGKSGPWHFNTVTYTDPFSSSSGTVDLITSMDGDLVTPVTFNFAGGAHAPISVVGTATPARVTLPVGTYTVTADVSNGAIGTAPHTFTISGWVSSGPLGPPVDPRQFEVPAASDKGLGFLGLAIGGIAAVVIRRKLI